jgi:hypothetical protein
MWNSSYAPDAPVKALGARMRARRGSRSATVMLALGDGDDNAGQMALVVLVAKCSALIAVVLIAWERLHSYVNS